MVPSPRVPRRNGRARGITSQAMTTSPSETIAPARVPGTDKFPNAPGDAGRCLTVFRRGTSYLNSRNVAVCGHRQDCGKSMVTFASILLDGSYAIFKAASARTDEPKEEYNEGYSAQDATNRMKPAPMSHEVARLLGSQIEFSAL